MPSAAKLIKKQSYCDKLFELLEREPIALIINVDNVGSSQLQNIRQALRGKATLLLGKNTLMRTALRQRYDETGEEALMRLAHVLRGNLGFIFCKSDAITEIRAVIAKNVLPASAKVGMEAPSDVILPSGPCGLDPGQTPLFQALNIGTKIVNGTIEITKQHHLIEKGMICNASVVELLHKLNIKPFQYGLTLQMVYQDGHIYNARFLDITDTKLTNKFLIAAENVAAVSREIGVPTESSIPQMFNETFKNIAALCADIDFDFPELEHGRQYLKETQSPASAPKTDESIIFQ